MNDSTFLDILSVVTPILVTAVGWSVRLVINQIRALREDLKEYVRRETCAAHRGTLQDKMMQLWRHDEVFARRLESLERRMENISGAVRYGRRAEDVDPLPENDAGPLE